MKLHHAIAGIVLTLSGYASAATIQASATTDVDFTTNPASYDNAITSAYTVKIGVYSGGALTTSANFNTINANWAQIGSFAASQGTGFAGFFNGTLTFTDAQLFAGQSVFVWVTNGSNENILLKAIGASAGDILYKTDAAIPNSGAVAFTAANRSSWQILLGSFTTGGANAEFGGSYVLNVPEPSAALLGALGAVGLLRRRRR